jgi:murein DD-endopeptidase MepM/ murein hydrolase activator NlpD
MSRIRDFFTQKLKNRYRLIVRNDESLQERVSLVLTPLNVLLLLSGFVVVFFFVFLLMVAYTPIGHLIPSQGNYANPDHVAKMERQLDSLESALNRREMMDTALRNILQGLPEAALYNDDIFHFSSLEQQPASLSKKKSGYRDLLFPPIRNGYITDTFDLERNHLAVDIVSYKNASVKSTSDGVVVLSSWTPETGNVLVLQHANNLISVYKHNSTLLKIQGDYVKAGEVIALIGNSGELSSGPHLHFELWLNGRPVNPLDFVSL